ncbi:hypothetical protein [Spirillospora sp. CA-128828]|uniref:hypothetical protein n=1 Tax=Spirillospora sp. CA-128828 TaxID=3240033 RepID=UPI003D93BA66
MIGMMQSLPRDRLAWTWLAAVYTALIAGTAIATLALLSRNVDLGQELWPDAQTGPQAVYAWRGGAILGYTSGSEVGHICALLAGLLAVRAVKARAWRAGLAVAVLAGTVLALVNLSLAWWKASPQLAQLAGPALYGTVDPGLRHHICVIVAIMLVFTSYLVFAAVGYFLGLKRRNKATLVLLAALLVAAPYSHFIAATILTPRVGL